MDNCVKSDELQDLLFSEDDEDFSLSCSDYESDVHYNICEDFENDILEEYGEEYDHYEILENED